MKIDRISYQKIFPTGMAYLNHKIGVEVQVDEGDDWQEAFEMAKRVVEKWNLESNPGYAVALEYMNGNPGAYSHKAEPKQSMEEAIISCTEIKVLESYKLLVKNNPSLQDIYDKKFAELKG
jgi:hypothetical protein